jgi:hypothetical protein
MVYVIINRYTDGGDGHSDWERPEFFFNRSLENINATQIPTDNVDLSQPFDIIYSGYADSNYLIDRQSFEVVNRLDEKTMLTHIKEKLHMIIDQKKDKHHSLSITVQEFTGIEKINSETKFPENLICYSLDYERKNGSISCKKLTKCGWAWKSTEILIDT